MKKFAASICLATAVLAPTAAFAYVGPGAGLSLLGALWALVAAVATALIFVIAWPIRRAMRRHRAVNRAEENVPPMDTASQAQTDEKSR